jgi:hypothetical protein
MQFIPLCDSPSPGARGDAEWLCWRMHVIRALNHNGVRRRDCTRRIVESHGTSILEHRQIDVGGSYRRKTIVIDELRVQQANSLKLVVAVIDDDNDTSGVVEALHPRME